LGELELLSLANAQGFVFWVFGEVENIFLIHQGIKK
jgi:hypothetical protein